jgi:type I restriction enzyme S subunit
MAIGNMQTHEHRRDSGIDWLGDIPGHWQIKPGLVALSENKRDNKGMKETQVLSLSYGNIVVKPEEKLTGLVPESFETYQVVEPGDIIIRGTDLQNDQTSLRTGLAKDRGIITSAYIGLRVKGGFNQAFVHYYLHALDTCKILYKFGSGLRQNLSFEDFKRLPIVEIPIDEQDAIVRFLNEKTAKIDAAIALEERQIFLLKERKQIVIQNAITKGLNPDAPMKDSGVDWIGEIPAHWDRLAQKHIFRLKKTAVGKRSSEYDLLSLTLRGIVKRDMANPEGKFPAEFDTYQEVMPGDFVFCHFDVEETPRTVGLSEHAGMITGAYTVYSACRKHEPRYLLNFHIFADTDKKLRSLYKGLRNTISKDVFGAFKMPIPPKDEQHEIVEHIDRESRKIDDAIALKKSQIAALAEYKATLINSAVTGKIKVA